MPEDPMTIPYGDLEVLFLDVGNTLVSMDFQWVSEELGRLGVRCTPEALRRAEAAARPRFSETYVEGGKTRPPAEIYDAYFQAVLEKLRPGDPPPPEVVRGLHDVLCAPGMTQRLWSWILPGVPAALDVFARLGLRMVVVSNSDGTVEEGLRARGLRDYFEAVVDSGRVGFEKPDPRIFELALELAQADPARTLHIGDLYGADVVGARSAGLHALLLDPYDDWSHESCPRAPDLRALAEAIGRARQEPVSFS